MDPRKLEVKVLALESKDTPFWCGEDTEFYVIAHMVSMSGKVNSHTNVELRLLKEVFPQVFKREVLLAFDHDYYDVF